MLSLGMKTRKAASKVVDQQVVFLQEEKLRIDMEVTQLLISGNIIRLCSMRTKD